MNKIVDAIKNPAQIGTGWFAIREEDHGDGFVGRYLDTRHEFATKDLALAGNPEGN